MKKPWMVEGLRYDTEDQVNVVAQRFAQRLGRDVTVYWMASGELEVESHVIDAHGKHKSLACQSNRATITEMTGSLL